MNSRLTITSATHGDARCTATSASSVVVTSSLSAVVSRNDPSLVVTPQRRASRPSNQSVTAAIRNTMTAIVSSRDSTSAMITGQATIRRLVPMASAREDRSAFKEPASIARTLVDGATSRRPCWSGLGT